MSDATTLLLIDHNRLFRHGLVRLMADSEFQVVAEVGTIAEALSSGHPLPALILIDPIAGQQGAAAIAALREAAPQARIVALTNQIDPTSLSPMLEAGADAFLLKDTTTESLVQKLKLVMLGEKILPNCVVSLLVNRSSDDGVRVGGNRLSQRETQILRHLLDGDSNKLIGKHLDITEATVKVHLKSVLRKIGVVNRTQAAMWAMNNGIEKHERMLETM
jgi:two-component system, NarL family, nitrate/nitrite response regulator NarL